MVFSASLCHFPLVKFMLLLILFLHPFAHKGVKKITLNERVSMRQDKQGGSREAETAPPAVSSGAPALVQGVSLDGPSGSSCFSDGQPGAPLGLSAPSIC